MSVSPINWSNPHSERMEYDWVKDILNVNVGENEGKEWKGNEENRTVVNGCDCDWYPLYFQCRLLDILAVSSHNTPIVPCQCSQISQKNLCLHLKELGHSACFAHCNMEVTCSSVYYLAELTMVIFLYFF